VAKDELLVTGLAANQLRLLTFREFKPNLRDHWRAYLGWGLFWTWMAGIGRYWDNPKAEWWQTLGLGSIAYIFTLALVLWLVILPLKPKNWTYRNILIFLSLTSLPAVLYAIPVERFMPLAEAQAVNAGFLAVVATWRVLLLWIFLRRLAQLRGIAILVACLLPLTLIVTTLAALNLEHVVFNLMAGNDRTTGTGNDAAYFVVLLMTMASFILAPFLALIYVALAVDRWAEARRERVKGE
jgi:hypothetical protein